MSDFLIGLQVTGIGMGLVFLTLILVMLFIMLLDRVFRPKPAVEEEAEPVVVVAPAATAPTAATTEDDTDLVAALAVAIAAALEEAASRPALAAAVPTADYGNLPPEVVTVARIDPGPGTWSGQGRLNALS